MKKLACLAVVACLCFAAPLAAHAEKVDMSKVTCAQMFEDEDTATYMYFWLDGYFSAKSGNTVLDAGGVEQDMEALVQLCTPDPDKKILDLLKK